ncbi:MAG TPA: S8 family serine peptidase, partial [Anaerolineae bacterium]|nr:S8 family serine peptidase [Anaerolineae bacterium]
VGGDATAGFADGSGFLYGLGIAPEVSIFAQNSLCGSNWPPIGGWQEHSKRSVLGGAVGSNNSWTTGEGTAHGYQASERTHDIMVRDGNFDTAGVAEPHMLVFSAGNSGPGAMTLTSPKDAKNLIVVANSLNQRVGSIDNISNSSSRGPAVDGRWTPTIAAPGTQIASTRNDLGGDCAVAIAGTSNLYAFCSGTSMAAPHVSGVLALVTQWWRTFNAGANPSPAIAKALVVNGAVDMGTADIPNTSEGWGRLNLTNIISSSVNVLYDDQIHTFDQTGQFLAKAIEVADPSRPLKITLAWTDAPGAVGANPALVNNLDLRVAAQNGTTYLGNVFNSGWSASNGSADTRNNLENVYIQNPSGRFIITIQATNLAADGVPYNGDTTDQDFALVCTNCISVPEGILAGTVTNAATTAPIDGATIVASASPIEVFSTNSGPDGQYSLLLPSDSYSATVSAFGYLTQTINNISVSANVTTTQNVALVGTPVLTVTTVSVSGGDGDAALEPNETANVRIGLTNLGFGAATNVTGAVATTHPQATLLNSVSGYATIAPGATVNNSLPFQVKLSPSFVCGDPLVLTATITSATGNFIVPVTIPTAQQFTPLTYISSNVPQNLPVPVSAVTSTLAITNVSQFNDVNVTLSISHTWDADLDLFLRAPNGTEVGLSSGNGGSGDHYLNTTFDDEAVTPITSGAPPFSGSFRPEQPLSLLDGSNANGTWALQVRDTEPTLDGGVLTDWRLTLLQPICEASPSQVYFPLIIKP